MKKYMFIFHLDHKIEDNAELDAAVMQWYDNLGEQLLDSGNPFDGEAEAYVTADKVEHKPDTAAGYSLISAKDLAEATKIAQGCPLLKEKGFSIKVYETMPM